MATDARLVGRDEELARIASVLDLALVERPGSVLVLGEAGVGKTAFLRATARLAGERGFATAIGSCAQSASGTTFAPFRAAFRPLAAAYGDRILFDVVASTPALAPLLPAPLRPTGTSDDATDVGPLYDAALELVGVLAGEAPLFLALDDLHWADRSSLELLSFLVRNMGGERLVLFGTARSEAHLLDDPGGRMLLECARVHDATRVDLHGLDTPALRELVTAFGAKLDDRDVVVLHERTSGNPFFALELLEADAVHSLELPRSVTDTIRLRLAMLDPDAAEAVGAASVAGAADPELVAAALGRDEADVERALRSAVAAGVLVTDSATGSVSFRHALLREVVYGGMLASQRRRMHGAVARALEEQAAADAAVLAHHYAAANRPADALRTSIAAARAAADMYGSADALAHYLRAVQLWKVVPKAARPESTDLHELLEEALTRALAVGALEEGSELATQLLGDIDPARDPERWALVAARVSELTWELGDAAGALALLERADEYLRGRPESLALVHVRERLAFQAILRGDGLEGGAIARETLEIAHRVGDPEGIVVALNRAALAATALGERDGVARLHEAFDAGARARLANETTRAAINLLLLLHTGGHLDDARRTGPRVLAVAEELQIGSAPRSALEALYARALVDAGEWDRADELLAGIRLGNGQRYRTYVAVAVAELAVARGDNALARRMIAESRFDLVSVLALRRACVEAELALAEGEPHVARAIADEYRPLAELILDASYARLTTYALLALAAGDEADADEYLHALRARTATVSQTPAGAPVDHRSWSLAAEAVHARVTGRPASACWAAAAEAFGAAGFVVRQAWAQVEQAAATVEEGGDRASATALVSDAHAFALRLGAEPIRHAAEQLVRRARLDVRGIGRLAQGNLGLTEREVEVLRLLACGSTNREIAGQLFISTKTASVHVSNILRKVGATTRGEAAAVAHREGLVEQAARTGEPR